MCHPRTPLVAKSKVIKLNKKVPIAIMINTDFRNGTLEQFWFERLSIAYNEEQFAAVAAFCVLQLKFSTKVEYS